jgi:hypothetical protein
MAGKLDVDAIALKKAAEVLQWQWDKDAARLVGIADGLRMAKASLLQLEVPF